MCVKASARKSLGEFKPILLYPDGSTKVVEQSPERFARNTRWGMVKGNRMARGTTYATREEAVAAAQKHIDVSLADCLARYNREWSQTTPASMIARWREMVGREILAWGGSIPDVNA